MKTEIEKKAERFDRIVDITKVMVEHWNGCREHNEKAAAECTASAWTSTADLHRGLERVAAAHVHSYCTVLIEAGIRTDCPCSPDCPINRPDEIPF